MAYKKLRRGGRKSNLKKVGRSNARAKMYNKNAKVASVVALAKSVNRMKKQIRKDTEMKNYVYPTAIGTTIGQVNVNNTGMYIANLDLMNIGAGVGIDNRIGTKVNLKGFQLRFQFSHQSNTSSACKYIIEVWKTKDFGLALSAVRDTLFNIDSISGVVDTNSSYGDDWSSIFSRVAKKSFTLPVDTFTGVNMIRDIKMFVKQNQELTYVSTATAVPQNVRYILTIRASVGNSNGSTASTLPNIVHTTALTGSVCRYVAKCWYTDN